MFDMLFDLFMMIAGLYVMGTGLVNDDVCVTIVGCTYFIIGNMRNSN